MHDRLDLFQASREELIALVLAQRDRIADLERRLAWQAEELATLRRLLAELTTRVGELTAAADGAAAEDVAGPPRGMPGLKAGPAPGQPTGERQQRAQGFGRRRMEPTAWETHALDACPRCRVPLSGGTVAHTREVIELPPQSVVVTEHRYLARRCPRCGGVWQPGPELAGVVVGRGRLGIGLLSRIAWLWAEARLPFGVIQDYLAHLHGLHLSQGTLVGAVQLVAARGKALVEEILAAIRASPVVHADETGWREDGANGYLWTLATSEHRSYFHGTRERSVLEEALGGEFTAVVVSDFYAAYTTLDRVRHQYCWAHLLRDVDEVGRLHPRDAAVSGWADALHQLFGRARAAADQPDPAERQRARQRCEAELSALIAPYLTATEAAAPPAALCRRMEKHLGDLFLFVEDPAVPPTNNEAERSLRHLVTSRKISGGTRSERGTETKLRLATLFSTWRLQGLDPLAECRQLLAAPQD
jgi:hypothetical protein